MDPVAAAAAAAAAADITGGLLVRTDPATAAVAAAAAAGINVSNGTLMTTASPFASHTPAIGGTTPVTMPNTSIAQQQQMHTSLLSELSASMHFCSSCKKRMCSDAFRRRKNGGLYSTCIACLERTKIRKGVQRCRSGGGAVASTERHVSPVASHEAVHSQQQPQGTGATTAIGVSESATNSLCAEQQNMSSESPSQAVADTWDEPLTPFSLGRAPTGNSDGHSLPRRLQHSSTSNNSSSSSETMASSSTINSLAPNDLGIVPPPPPTTSLSWSSRISQADSRSALPLLSPMSVVPSLHHPVPEILIPTTSPLSPPPSAKRRRASTVVTHCTHPAYDTTALQHNTGHVIPDAYVQLEFQRLELERQRLALDQERWREERAERMRWEQMYREQWQEEREERKAFRERELHVWKILLSLKSPTDHSGL
ncbi:hypothetical protein IW140_003710 [Coemansia sp. RSA 1813]|nr:hypothetical protein EV178_003675 [Coemansia sp. RSA 1646]KAJ1768237.1 hypothetical protein LPJ74_004957 [Coemansia sp. RSA 1843]KAJ2088714.1 hypothetical protein IW138_003986 [Coemansia sp. RSA 986]KAJ2213667.1 hypothetical protein EV179_003667 [Coemansia sp. RSA 487]KAJ2568616.1 hypothetical protein IW140_003710 [Coemansia sp. RSA 1813]